MTNEPSCDQSQPQNDLSESAIGRILAVRWPGVQLYYPPVKYIPDKNVYETTEQAAERFRKHAIKTRAHTILFDLEDGCRKKAESRDLLRQEIAAMRSTGTQVAIRINPFLTDEYKADLILLRDIAESVDVVVLAKAGEAYGAAEIRDLSSFLAGINPSISIQPIIEHPKSLKVAPELMTYSTVDHVIFGIHDFSKAMAIHITPEHWIDELASFLTRLLYEARLAGKGVIGGVETLISRLQMPDDHIEPDDIRRWLDLHGDRESRIVYAHAQRETALGLTGKQVIHPYHINLCRAAFTPSPGQIRRQVAILKAAIAADALRGGAIRFEGEMLDPPMFGKALQALLRANALTALDDEARIFLAQVLRLLPEQVIRENWPYAVLL